MCLFRKFTKRERLKQLWKAGGMVLAYALEAKFPHVLLKRNDLVERVRVLDPATVGYVVHVEPLAQRRWHVVVHRRQGAVGTAHSPPCVPKPFERLW
jgi:hypothetical protein